MKQLDREDINADSEGVLRTPEATHQWVSEEQSAMVEPSDLMEELYDVKDILLGLAREGKTEQIGTVVCAVHDAYIARLTSIRIYGDAKGLPYAETAATLALSKVAQ